MELTPVVDTPQRNDPQEVFNQSRFALAAFSVVSGRTSSQQSKHQIARQNTKKERSNRGRLFDTKPSRKIHDTGQLQR